jgi:hypothetical protein
MRAGLLGQITTPASNNLLEPGVPWCADNGIYSRSYPGDGGYLGWLRRLPGHADCQFAVAPDVVADHDATLERSWPMLRRIRETVGSVALCAQNGATPDDLPWEYIDVIFLAGIVECLRCDYMPAVTDLPMKSCPNGHVLTEWKVGAIAEAIAAEGKARGKWVHMGRVNTLSRLIRASRMGCDSADGTFLAYGPDVNLARMLRYLRSVKHDQAQLSLFDMDLSGPS